MPLTNMAITPEEAKEKAAEYASPSPANAGDMPKYPYGLCLCLNDESMKKLGLTDPMPVGTEVTVTARAKITSVRACEEVDGDKDSSMDVQITELEISPVQRQPNPQALYSNSNMS